MSPLSDKYRKVHCIGIGGSGVGSLARFLNKAGLKVSGSDQKNSPVICQMVNDGLKILIGQKSGNIPDDTDLVIYSSAIPASNPERLEAASRRLTIMSYPQAIGLLTKEYETISVCGTHGKTTTTAMAALAFTKSSTDPGVIVGAPVPGLGGNSFRYGKGKYFILESCEHFRSFLNYAPSHVIVTNIDLDHLDYYKDLPDYISAFRDFFMRIPVNGLLVANGDDPNIRRAIEGIKTKKIIFYGQGSGNLYRIRGNEIFYKGKKIFTFDLKIPGTHNIYNATAAFALCHELGLDMSACASALNGYSGSGRRFEIKGKIGNTTIIDDYAHHPVEITATLKSLRQKYGPAKKVLCVFQPHQYSRTRHLLEGFVNSFYDADEIIVSDILKVRDSNEDVQGIDAEAFAGKIAEKYDKVRYGGGLSKIADSLKPKIGDYDFIITMGAGDVWKVADALIGTKPGTCA
jgi:UDP-N-acetylmuramate--alanine ligase